jgi:hypothetical protein
MKTIAHSNDMNAGSRSQVSRAIVALGVAGVLLAAIAPAAAHKSGKHEKQEKHEKHGKHGKHGHPMQNEGVPKPQPAPSIGGGQWHANPTPPIVHDHRPKPVVRDHRATPEIRDHRATPEIRDHRAPRVVQRVAPVRERTDYSGAVKVTANKGSKRGMPCLGNLCGLKKTYEKAKSAAIKYNTPR